MKIRAGKIHLNGRVLDPARTIVQASKKIGGVTMSPLVICRFSIHIFHSYSGLSRGLWQSVLRSNSLESHEKITKVPSMGSIDET
jgi:hypothetical protein